MATDIYKRVTLKDRDFTIQKFDAKTGLKLARLLMTKMEPLVPLLAADDENEKDVESLSDGGAYKAAFAILGELKDEDIDDLIDKCLRVCFADLPAGLQPVIDSTGHYGVEDVEYDPILTIMLCVEAIKWGAADFFGGNSYLSSLFKK